MPNEVRTPFESTAITMSSAAAIEANRLVKISANNTCADASTAGDHVIGILMKEATAAGQNVAVELLKYSKKIEVVASGALTFGQFVKAATASGALQRVTLWVQGTDNESLKIGVVLIGAADAAVATILA